VIIKQRLPSFAPTGKSYAAKINKALLRPEVPAMSFPRVKPNKAKAVTA